MNEKLEGKVSIAAEKIFNSIGAETMKSKVIEETIKHDEKYINSLFANLEKEQDDDIQQGCNDQKNSEEANQLKPDSPNNDDTASMF